MADLYFKVKADYDEVIKLQKEIRNLENQLRNLKLGQPFDELTKRIDASRSRMDALVRSAAIAGQNLRTAFNQSQMNVPFDKATKSTTNLSHSLRETHAAMQDLKSSTTGASINIGNFVKNFTIASTVVAGLHKAVNLLKNSMGTIVSFEAANASLMAITSSTADELKELRDSALDLGRTTVFTASQVTQLQTELAKLGFQKDTILQMTEPVLQFAMSVGADLPDAASTAGAALRMFQKDASETAEIVGAMSAATRLSALDFPTISANLATFGPMAHSIGLTIEDVLALFGTLKNAGVEGSTAMTSLRNIFTKVAQGKIEGMGPVKTLQEFVDGLKALGSLDVGKGMKMIGPRGGTQFITLMQQADSIIKLRDDIEREEKGTAEMAETMNNNVAGSLKMLSSAWEGFVLSMSNTTGPVKDVIDTVTDGINKMTDMLSAGTGNIDINFDSDGMQAAIGSMEILIGTIVAYKAIQEGAAGIDRVRLALGAEASRQYLATAAALAEATAMQEASLDADLQKLVNTKNLTLSQAQLIQTTREKAGQELAAAEAAEIRAKAERDLALSIYNEAAAEDKAIASTRLANAQSRLTQAEKRREAAEHLVNAGAEGIETGATNTLNAALRALGLTMLANPITWLAGAIVGLGYVTYKLITAEDEAKVAQDALNDSVSKYNDALKTSNTNAQSYKKTLQSNTATAYQQLEAYKKLIAEYRELGRYTMEELAKMSQEEFDRILNKENDDKLLRHAENLVKAIDSVRKGIDNPERNGGKSTSELIKDAEKLYHVDLSQLNESMHWYTNRAAVLDEALKGAKDSVDEIKKGMAEAANNLTMSGDEKETYKGYFDEAKESLKGFLEDTKRGKENVSESAVTYSKKLDEVIKNVESRISQLKKNPMTPENLFQLSNSQKVLDDVMKLKALIEASVKDPIKMEVIVDYLQGKQQVSKLPNGATFGGMEMPDWGDYSFAKPSFYFSPADFEKQDGKTEPEPDPTGEEEAEKAKRERERKEKAIKDATNALIDLRKKQAEDLAKQAISDQNAIENAEIGAMAEGQKKKLRAMDQKHEEELQKIKQQERDRIAKAESSARALFDAEEKLATAKSGKNARNWNELSQDERLKRMNATGTSIGLDAGGNFALTGSDAERINKLTETEKQRDQKARDDFNRTNKEALLKYLQDYGTFEEKKLAITEEFEQKIQDAINDGNNTEVAKLSAELEAKLSSLKFDELKKNLDWDEVFNNLEYKSKEALQKLHDELVEMLSFGDLSAENAKSISEQLDKVRQQIFEKGNIWSQIFSSGSMGDIMQHMRFKEEAKTANEDAERARGAFNSAKNDLDRESVLSANYLRRNGIDTKIDGKEIDILNEEQQKKLVDKYSKDEGKSSLLASTFEDLRSKKRGVKDAEEKSKDADRKAKNAKERADASGMGGSFGASMGMAGMIAQNMESLNHLSESLGLDDTGIGEKMGQIAEVGSSAMGAMQSFMSGDFVGAAASVVDTFTSIGAIFGATYGNMEKMNKDIEHLTDTNKGLISALGDVKESLEKSTIEEAVANYEKAVRLASAAQANSSKIMIDESRKWEKGSHSIASKLDGDNKFAQLLQTVNQELGTNVKDSAGLLSMSAKQWKELRENDTDTYNKILDMYRNKEGAHTGSGIDELIEQYIEDYADEFDQLTDLVNEKITGISFNSLFDNFVATLQNMDSKASDFAETFEGYLNNIQIKDLAEGYKKDLDKWYEKWKTAQRNGMSSAMRAELMAEKQDIIDEALAERDSMIAAGLIKDPSAYSQDYSKGVGSMTEETADEMNGRLTALQVTGEQLRNYTLDIKENISNMTQTVVDALKGFRGDNNVVSEIQEMIASSYIELREINTNTALAARLLVSIEENMGRVKDNTDRL